MLTRLLAWVSCAILTLSLCTQPAAQIKAGDPCPELTGTWKESAQPPLAALRGKLVLIDFWSSWAGWSDSWDKQYLKELRRMQDKFAARGMLTIVVTELGEEQVNKELEKQALGFPLLIADEALALSYGVKNERKCVVIDPDGNLAWRGSAGYELPDDVLERLLERTSIVPLAPTNFTEINQHLLYKSLDRSKAHKALAVALRKDPENKDLLRLQTDLEHLFLAAMDSATAKANRGDWCSALADYEQLCSDYTGCEQGERAKAAKIAAQKNPEAKKELAAAKIFEEGKQFERAREYDKALARYRGLQKSHLGTFSAGRAEEAIAELLHKGIK